jgi:DNA polymerase III delta prime subunit
MSSVILEKEKLPDILQLMLKYPDTRSHMLFIGPPGSGKTTTAQSYAIGLHGKVLNSFSSIMFLNSSDERSLDMIRNKIYPFVESRMQSLFFQGAHAPPKVIIFDEAETLTDQAQCALRPLLQRNTKEVIIIFICNSLSHIHPQILNKFVVVPFIPTLSVNLQKIVMFKIPKLDIILRRGDIRFFKHRPDKKQQITQCIAKAMHSTSKDNIYSVINESGTPFRERITWFLIFNHYISSIEFREIKLWSSLSSSDTSAYLNDDTTKELLFKLWSNRIIACIKN